MESPAPTAQRGRADRDAIPDSWSPANRVAEPRPPFGQVAATIPRDEVDAFRNLRLAPPETLPEAIRATYLAQEWYEHAQHDLFLAETVYYEYIGSEDVTREQNINALMTTKAMSRTAAEKVVDTTDQMRLYLERKRTLGNEKARRTLELSIARRRHAVAVSMLQVAGTTGFLPHIIYSQQMDRAGESVRLSEMEASLARYRDQSAPEIADNLLELHAAEVEANGPASGSTFVTPLPDVTAGDTEAATNGEGRL